MQDAVNLQLKITTEDS